MIIFYIKMNIRAGGGSFRAAGGSFRAAGCSPLLFLFMGNTTHTMKWVLKEGFLQTCACTDYREAEKTNRNQGIKNNIYTCVFF